MISNVSQFAKANGRGLNWTTFCRCKWIICNRFKRFTNFLITKSQCLVKQKAFKPHLKWEATNTSWPMLNVPIIAADPLDDVTENCDVRKQYDVITGKFPWNLHYSRLYLFFGPTKTLVAFPVHSHNKSVCLSVCCLFMNEINY